MKDKKSNQCSKKERLKKSLGEVSVTSQEWSEIRNTLNEYYPNSLKKLNEIHHFSATQLQLYMLIKAEFSPSDIAKLTGMPKQNVSSGLPNSNCRRS